MDAIYQRWAGKQVQGQINFALDTLRIYLVRETGAGNYTPNLLVGGDEFLAIIPGTAIIAFGTLTGVSVTADGIFNAATTAVASVTGVVSSLVLVKWTGSSATSPLIARLDSYAGLGTTFAGINLQVVWPTTAAKIFKLG